VETWFTPNDAIRKCLSDMKTIWNKIAFWDVNNMKWRKWCNIVSPFLFNNTYGLPVLTMENKCPNQVFYDRLVLNRGRKRDALQITLFVYVNSTWSIVELKTRFETWIIRNDVNGVSLVNLWYLITLMNYLRSYRTPNFQIKYFTFDWSIYRLFVLHTCWKLDFLQMMIFVNICSTWSMVQIKTRFDASRTKNDVNGEFVSLSLFSNTYGLPVLPKGTKCPNQGFYVLLIDLQTIWANYGLET
jgi:hypothetical protein